MAEQSVTAVLASLGMQYGFTSFELATIATDLAAGRSGQEIVREMPGPVAKAANAGRGRP